MTNETNAIILLDDKSKEIINTRVSSLGAHGFRFITTLVEINDEITADCKRLIVLDGFSQYENSVQNLVMYKELYELEIFYLGSGKHFQMYSAFAYCFECDLALLDLDVVNAALYKDITQTEENATDYFNVSKIAQEAVADNSNADREFKDLAAGYLNAIEELDILKEREGELKEHNQLLLTENAKLRFDREKLLKGYCEIIQESEALNRTLKEYEMIFTNDIYEKLRLHDYVEKPLILYLKEYEDFINLEELLKTLFSVFRVQNRKSVKVLRLFDSSTSRKMLTLPNYYRVFYNKYLMSDVIGSDFIAKSGDYKKILDKLLMNEAGLDVLIIVDSKDFNDIVLTGTPLQLNLCREKQHRDSFGLSVSNTLLNEGDDDSAVVWKQYDTTGMSNDEKFIFLSSKPIIKNIITLSKIFERTV